MNDVYKNLERSMLSISDYQSVEVIDNGEFLVPIRDTLGLVARQRGEDMKQYTGDTVYVREDTLARLSDAASLLTSIDRNLALSVTYGYRALQVQIKNFEVAKLRFVGEYTGDSLDLAAHRLVAKPDVAGHPTGGAVDIQIVEKEVPVDFGTKMGEFVPDTYAFSPFVGREAMKNRMLLRAVMMSVGFAPFDGEWWHFSYGDKEWSRYTNQSTAIYSQLNFQTNMIADNN